MRVQKTEEWYRALCEELKSAWVEYNFQLTWGVIERNHILGRILRQTSVERGVNISQLVRITAKDVDCSEQLLWQCVQFFDKYPSLDAVPDGKAAVWSRLRLTLGGETREEKPPLDVIRVVKRLIKNYGVEICRKIAEKIIEATNPQRFDGGTRA